MVNAMPCYLAIEVRHFLREHVFESHLGRTPNLFFQKISYDIFIFSVQAKRAQRTFPASLFLLFLIDFTFNLLNFVASRL